MTIRNDSLVDVPPYAVREARVDEGGACRALLPETFPVVGRAPDLLIAERAGAIVGACALAWIPGGFPLAVAVREQDRRRGVGRALVAFAIARARGETPGLRTWSPQSEGDVAARFLAACGFAAAARMQVYEMEPTRLGESIAPLVARARGKVPAGIAFVSLRDAPRGPLLDLVSANLTTPRPYLEEALSGDGTNGWDQALSAALVLDGRLVGALLARRVGTTMVVDLNVVAADFRGGWANLLQLDDGIRRFRAGGMTWLRFIAAPHVRNTINLARRGGGTRLADQVTMALALG